MTVRRVISCTVYSKVAHPQISITLFLSHPDHADFLGCDGDGSGPLQRPDIQRHFYPAYDFTSSSALTVPFYLSLSSHSALRGSRNALNGCSCSRIFFLFAILHYEAKRLLSALNMPVSFKNHLLFNTTIMSLIVSLFLLSHWIYEILVRLAAKSYYLQHK